VDNVSGCVWWWSWSWSSLPVCDACSPSPKQRRFYLQRGRGVIELAKYWHPKEDRRAHANCPKIVEFVEKFIAERDAVKEESDAESFD
jgi:hypothetical protein